MTKECQKVGLDYFDEAPTRFKATQTIEASPSEIFDVLLDAEAWTKWVWAIKRVVWTSPFPIEAGSTREVHMVGDLVGYEEFLAFNYGKRMAFRFNQISKGDLSAFAEDYQVTDLGNGKSRIDWTMAMGSPGEPAPGFKGKIREAIMGRFVKLTLWRLRRFVESNPVLASR